MEEDTGSPLHKLARRRFLIGAGAVTVVVAGGVVWRGLDRGVFSTSRGPAYELWDKWDDEELSGTALALVAAGVMAANPHNTQPWLFHLHGSQIDLYADHKRNLGAFDPYLREMYLGLGCAIENMMLAASANGIYVLLSLQSGSLRRNYSTGPALVATLKLAHAEPRKSVLYDAIGKRHTNRGPYDRKRGLDQEYLAAMPDFANTVRQRIYLFTDGEDRERFDRVTLEATDAIIADEAMARDSENWFRFSHNDVQKHRDGITLEANGMSPAMLAAAKMLPPVTGERAHGIWRETTKDVHLATAPVTGCIAVRGLYDIPTTLDAGRLWQRLHLWATAQGFAMQPLNQAPEMVDRELALERTPRTANELVHLTGDPDLKPTFAFRAGYPAREALPSPRRALKNVVVAEGV